MKSAPARLLAKERNAVMMDVEGTVRTLVSAMNIVKTIAVSVILLNVMENAVPMVMCATIKAAPAASLNAMARNADRILVGTSAVAAMTTSYA